MSAESDPGFHAVCTREMRREGIKGKRAAVTLRAGRLGIVGEDGGAIWIDLADIAVTLWNTTARLAPRPIKEPGELDRQLP